MQAAVTRFALFQPGEEHQFVAMRGSLIISGATDLTQGGQKEMPAAELEEAWDQRRESRRGSRRLRNKNSTYSTTAVVKKKMFKSYLAALLFLEFSHKYFDTLSMQR